MGNLGLRPTTQVPQEVRSQFDTGYTFSYYVALCRLSGFARLLRTGNDRCVASKEIIENNKYQHMTGCVLAFLSNESQLRTISYAISTLMDYVKLVHPCDNNPNGIYYIMQWPTAN